MNQFLDVTLRAKIMVSVIGLCFILFLLYLLSKKRLTANFALGWIFVTILAVSTVLIHPLLRYLTLFSGIRIGALAISLYAFVFIFAMLIIFSIKLSQLSQQTRKLAQLVALLEMEIGKLKESA